MLKNNSSIYNEFSEYCNTKPIGIGYTESKWFRSEYYHEFWTQFHWPLITVINQSHRDSGWIVWVCLYLPEGHIWKISSLYNLTSGRRGLSLYNNFQYFLKNNNQPNNRNLHTYIINKNNYFFKLKQGKVCEMIKKIYMKKQKIKIWFWEQRKQIYYI